MKKVIFISIPLIAVIGILTILLKSTAGKSECPEADSFVIIDSTPYILSEGNAYCFGNGNEWTLYETGYGLTQLFRGEYFCAVTDEGNILFETGITYDEYSSYPLGSAYIFSMAECLTGLSQENPVLTLNHSPEYEDCRALCRDGTLLLNSYNDYSSFTLPDEVIKDISGDFALTESGSVYQIRNTLDEGKQSISFEKVSDGPIIMIDSCETAPRCVGIYSDGRAVMWSDLTPLDLSEWKDVAEVSVGFNYCVGVTTGGKILYADYDKERESNIADILKRKTAEHVTCSYEMIALLLKDGSAEIINLSE